MLGEAEADTRDLVELSRTLGARLRRECAPAGEKAYADAILGQLAADRLLWCAAPRRFGGDAASLGDVARVTFHVARLSGSAGLIYAMHMSQALSVVRHGGDGAFFSAFMDRMTRDQALVASGTSEKGVGGDIFGSRCCIEADPGGGLSLTKESPNISYLDLAGATLVSALHLQPNGRKSQVLVAVDREAMDLRPGAGGDFIGMRGILNRPYAFTARVNPSAIFADSYPVIARETMTPVIHVLWAALWSGIASCALSKAKAYLTREASTTAEAGPLMWADLSRLNDKHYQMNAIIRDAIAAQDGRSAAGMGLLRTAQIKRLKIVCSDLLQEICLGALGIVGMRGYAEGGPYSLSEPLRDALSAKVMISNYRLLVGNTQIERYIEDVV